MQTEGFIIDRTLRSLASRKEEKQRTEKHYLWHLKLSAAHYHRSTAATYEINIENSFDRKPPRSIMLAELNCVSFTNRPLHWAFCSHISALIIYFTILYRYHFLKQTIPLNSLKFLPQSITHSPEGYKTLWMILD